MAIPPTGDPIPMSLRRMKPTAFTPEILAEQLANVGLSCDELTEEFLQESIDRVTNELFPGKIECYKIENRSTPTATDHPVATWEWDDDDPTALGYELYLKTIIVPEHFSWLLKNSPNNQFFGKENSHKESGEKDNADAIEEMFIQCGLLASSTLDEGMNKKDLEASLTNAIAHLSDDSLTDYHVPEGDDPWPSMVMMLVENYNPNTGSATGIGILSYRWTMTIKDFKRKSKHGGDKHGTSLEIIASSVLYRNIDGVCLMCNHYDSVIDYFEIDDQLENCRDRAKCDQL